MNNPLDALTPEQSRLYDTVLTVASWDGRDARPVLIAQDATPADKAAVAQALGGPGAGNEFLHPDPTAEARPAEDTAEF